MQVFALQQNFALEAVAKVGRVGEGGLFDDIVDTGRKDEAEVLLKSVFGVYLIRRLNLTSG